MPNWHVVRVQVVGADRAYDDFPRIDPHAYQDGDAALAPQLFGIALPCLLHA